jgi:S1-C subfamily serine protease
VRTFQLDITATHGNSGGPVFTLTNEKVIGVLQGGILHPSGSLLAGLVRCEPVYRFLGGNEVEFLKTLPFGQAVDLAELKKLKAG